MRCGPALVLIGSIAAGCGTQAPGEQPPPGEAPRVAQPYRGPLEGTVYEGSTSGKTYQIDLGSFDVTDGKLRVIVSAVEGSDCVYDYLEIVDGQGVARRIEAEDSTYTSGDEWVATHIPDHHWWLQNYQSFSDGKGLVALRSERPAPLVTEVELSPGDYHLFVGSFTGDPANGPFVVRVKVESG